MSTLHWRDSVSEDNSELQQFACVSPERRIKTSSGMRVLPHPHPWGKQVQSHIRQDVRAGPPFVSYTVRVGCDDEGIAAVYAVSIDGEGDAFIHFMARASRYKGVHAVADEALVNACDWAVGQGDARDLNQVVVQGKVHRENAPSLAVLQRHGGFAYVMDDGDFQVWEAEYDLTSLGDPEPERALDVGGQAPS